MTKYVGVTQLAYIVSLVLCIAFILLGVVFFVINVVAGHFVWAFILFLCVIFNAINLIRLFNAGRYL